MDNDTTPAETTVVAQSLNCPELPADSIFNKPVFPTVTGRPYAFTPLQAKQVFDRYANTHDSLNNCCKMIGVIYEELRRAQYVFLELRAYHDQAQARRTDALVEHCGDIVANHANDLYIDQDGQIRPNNAAVRKDELYLKYSTWFAERLNPRYRPKTESHNVNLNINALPPIKPADLFKARDWQDVD